MKTLIISFCSLLLLCSPALVLSEEGFKGQPSSYGSWQLNKFKSKNKSPKINNAPAKHSVIIIPAAEAELRGQAIERQQIIDRTTGADRPRSNGSTRNELEKARLEKSGSINKSKRLRELEENPEQYFYNKAERDSRWPTVIVNH